MPEEVPTLANNESTNTRAIRDNESVIGTPPERYSRFSYLNEQLNGDASTDAAYEYPQSQPSLEWSTKLDDAVSYSHKRSTMGVYVGAFRANDNTDGYMYAFFKNKIYKVDIASGYLIDIYDATINSTNDYFVAEVAVGGAGRLYAPVYDSQNDESRLRIIDEGDGSVQWDSKTDGGYNFDGELGCMKIFPDTSFSTNALIWLYGNDLGSNDLRMVKIDYDGPSNVTEVYNTVFTQGEAIYSAGGGTNQPQHVLTVTPGGDTELHYQSQDQSTFDGTATVVGEVARTGVTTPNSSSTLCYFMTDAGTVYEIDGSTVNDQVSTAVTPDVESEAPLFGGGNMIFVNQDDLISIETSTMTIFESFSIGGGAFECTTNGESTIASFFGNANQPSFGYLDVTGRVRSHIPFVSGSNWELSLSGFDNANDSAVMCRDLKTTEGGTGVGDVIVLANGVTGGDLRLAKLTP